MKWQEVSPLGLSENSTGKSLEFQVLARGAAQEDVARGIVESVADRVAPLAERLAVRGPAAMTGGVARNAAVVAALEKKLKANVLVPDSPELAGALGAAVIAHEIAAG